MKSKASWHDLLVSGILAWLFPLISGNLGEAYGAWVGQWRS
jgi:hypothetical protein